MNDKVARKIGNAASQEFGYHGSKDITDTTVTTPDSGYEFVAIQFLSSTVVSAYAQPTDAVACADLTAFASIGEGSTIYGRFSSITLTSGDVVAYQGIAQTAID